MFLPFVGLDIVGPEIVEINSEGCFSSEDYEIGIEKFGDVVGSLPR